MGKVKGVDSLVSYSQAYGALIFIAFLAGSKLFTWIFDDGLSVLWTGGLPMGILFISTLGMCVAVRSMVNDTKKKLHMVE